MRNPCTPITLKLRSTTASFSPVLPILAVPVICQLDDKESFQNVEISSSESDAGPISVDTVSFANVGARDTSSKCRKISRHARRSKGSSRKRGLNRRGVLGSED